LEVIADSIEREVLIDAPLETVWSIVTEPAHIGTWLGDSAEVDLRPGGELVVRFGDFGDANGTVEKVERPNVFAFRWVTPEPDRPADLGMEHATLVEFQLRAEAGGTMLRMIESGFAAIPASEEENDALRERHTGGWGTFIDQLAAHAVSEKAAA
jgi:uncharacterized protein YndB with AHSA1/START domain